MTFSEGVVYLESGIPCMHLKKQVFHMRSINVFLRREKNTDKRRELKNVCNDKFENAHGPESMGNKWALSIQRKFWKISREILEKILFHWISIRNSKTILKSNAKFIVVT